MKNGFFLFLRQDFTLVALVVLKQGNRVKIYSFCLVIPQQAKTKYPEFKASLGYTRLQQTYTQKEKLTLNFIIETRFQIIVIL